MTVATICTPTATNKLLGFPQAWVSIACLIEVLLIKLESNECSIKTVCSNTECEVNVVYPS